MACKGAKKIMRGWRRICEDLFAARMERNKKNSSRRKGEEHEKCQISGGWVGGVKRRAKSKVIMRLDIQFICLYTKSG